MDKITQEDDEKVIVCCFLQGKKIMDFWFKSNSFTCCVCGGANSALETCCPGMLWRPKNIMNL